MKINKYGLIVATVILGVVRCGAQTPIQWDFDIKQVNEQEVMLFFSAVIEPGWKLYAPGAEEIPGAARIEIDPSPEYKIIGEVEEVIPPVRSFDPLYGAEVSWYEGVARFARKIKLRAPVATVTGSVTYTSCNDMMCQPPRTETFALKVTGKKDSEKE